MSQLQEYFKQSTTRLFFILDKISEMIVELEGCMGGLGFRVEV